MTNAEGLILAREFFVHWCALGLTSAYVASSVLTLFGLLSLYDAS